jgi:hypothetical protein
VGQQLSDLAAQQRGTPGTMEGLGRPQLSAKGTNPISQVLAQVQAVRDNRKAQSPLLAEYLAWHQAHPTNDVEDFLKAKRAGQVAAP